MLDDRLLRRVCVDIMELYLLSKLYIIVLPCQLALMIEILFHFSSISNCIKNVQLTMGLCCQG